MFFNQQGFDTTHFAGSLHSFDVVDAIEYQKGFAVLVGSKKPFTIQGKDITRGFAVVLLDENMKMTRWVDAQYPTMVPVGPSVNHFSPPSPYLYSFL
jgi:hypothetical protein